MFCSFSRFPFSPLVIFHDLEFIALYYQDAQTVFYVSMLMNFLILIDLITYFNRMFPSFGLLFLTLDKARNDLMIMLFYMFIILLGFATWANIQNGSHNPDFQDLPTSLCYLFQYVIFLKRTLNYFILDAVLLLFRICCRIWHH